MNLDTLKKSILEDGKIDANEVAQIREFVFKDGEIDQHEADLLFDLNTECSDAENDASWQPLFVEAISSFLLDDENSPNAIDEVEAKWLISKIGEDGQVDNNEKALLIHLKDKAQSMPASLSEYINKYA